MKRSVAVLAQASGRRWIAGNLAPRSGESRDGGPTATSSHKSDDTPHIVTQKCMRCEERGVISALERRKRLFQWRQQGQTSPIQDAPAAEGSGGPHEIKPAGKRPRSGFRHGELKEEARPGPLCRPCFAKETIGITLLYAAIWLLANVLHDGYRTSRIGERMANFPAPRLLQALFFCTQAILPGLFHLTKWGKKPSAIAGISWKSYFLRVVPPGIATAIDVNLSVPHPMIPDNFKTMSKSGAPIIVLLLSYAFLLEMRSFQLTASVASLTTGNLLTVAKALEHTIVLPELVLLTAGSFVTAFRWTGTQILLQREILQMATPFSTMRVMKPVMAIITITISYYTESWGTLGENPHLDTNLKIMLTTLVSAGGLALATFKTVAELMLLARTSAVTYTVATIVKDVGYVLAEMIAGGWSSFFEKRAGLEGSMNEQTIGLHYISLGLVLFFWHRYLQWNIRVRGRLQFIQPQPTGIQTPPHGPDSQKEDSKSVHFDPNHKHSQ